MRNYNVYLEPQGDEKRDGRGQRTERYQWGRIRQTMRSKRKGRDLPRVAGKCALWVTLRFGNWPAFFVCPKSEGNHVIEELIRTRSAL